MWPKKINYLIIGTLVYLNKIYLKVDFLFVN